MANKITVVFLMAWGNTSISYKKGKEIPLERERVISLYGARIVKIKSAAEEKKLKVEIEGIKTKKLEDEAKAKSILEQGVIQNELNELYLAVVLKEAELNGEVLSDEETLEAVEAISKRDAVANK